MLHLATAFAPLDVTCMVSGMIEIQAMGRYTSRTPTNAGAEALSTVGMTRLSHGPDTGSCYPENVGILPFFTAWWSASQACSTVSGSRPRSLTL